MKKIISALFQTTIIIQVIFTNLSFGQGIIVTEDFEDGDFTNNPSWYDFNPNYGSSQVIVDPTNPDNMVLEAKGTYSAHHQLAVNLPQIQSYFDFDVSMDFFTYSSNFGVLFALHDENDYCVGASVHGWPNSTRFDFVVGHPGVYQGPEFDLTNYLGQWWNMHFFYDASTNLAILEMRLKSDNTLLGSQSYDMTEVYSNAPGVNRLVIGFEEIDLQYADNIVFMNSGNGSNHMPVADAGMNSLITSEGALSTVIIGSASDSDPDDLLQYRWLEGTEKFLDWTNVDSDGSCILDLSTLSLDIGQHTLTLEVTDGQATASDDMILTIENSAPSAAVTGGSGTYEINSIITLSGEMSDYDGDLLKYQWLNNTLINCEGQIQTSPGGDPVQLPDCIIDNLDLGSHTITLSVNDGINAEVATDITVEIVDQTVPTLAPVINKSILWPPNHDMVDIAINANAADNSGNVILSANISSNEPIDGLGDGDMSPDWTEPQIDQENGIISFQLRTERSGTGDGRVYTIVITATDESNNVSTAEIEVIVPHNKGKKE